MGEGNVLAQPLIPLWLIFLLTAGIAFLSMELGFALGQRRRRREEGDVHEESRAASGALLGFLAFVLAISFGNQASRFDDYRSLGVEEANAIQKAWLDAEWVPSPHRETFRAGLEKYVDQRIEMLRADAFEDLLQRSNQLHEQLWNDLKTAVRETGLNKPLEQLSGSLVQVRMLHNERVAVGLIERMHPVAWMTLVTLMVLSMGSMGYSAGIAGSRRTGIRIVVALSFSILVTIVADLNRPETGRISVDQQPLEVVRARMISEP